MNDENQRIIYSGNEFRPELPEWFMRVRFPCWQLQSISAVIIMVNLEALYLKSLDKSTTSAERLACKRMFVKLVLKVKPKSNNDLKKKFSKAASKWKETNIWYTCMKSL